MYSKRKQPSQTSLRRNEGYIGEPLEIKIDRIKNNKEPIEGSAPLIYTERSEGVRADTNIRTDRWDMALDAMDTATKAVRAKRADRAAKAKVIKMEEIKKAEPSQ